MGVEFVLKSVASRIDCWGACTNDGALGACYQLEVLAGAMHGREEHMVVQASRGRFVQVLPFVPA